MQGGEGARPEGTAQAPGPWGQCRRGGHIDIHSFNKRLLPCLLCQVLCSVMGIMVNKMDPYGPHGASDPRKRVLLPAPLPPACTVPIPSPACSFQHLPLPSPQSPCLRPLGTSVHNATPHPTSLYPPSVLHSPHVSAHLAYCLTPPEPASHQGGHLFSSALTCPEPGQGKALQQAHHAGLPASRLQSVDSACAFPSGLAYFAQHAAGCRPLSHGAVLCPTLQHTICIYPFDGQCVLGVPGLRLPRIVLW